MRSLRDRLANSWLGMLSSRIVSSFEFMLLNYYKKDAPRGVE
jgi:hypothetical protein